MTDRAQPGAQGSTLRNVEAGESAGSLSDGFIVPSSDPTLSAQRYNDLDENQFNEFNASWSSGSLDVTIDAGEAFVKGWLARDTQTTVTLDSFTNGQTVVVAWDADAVYVYDDSIHSNREDADRVIVTREADLPTLEVPYIPIWRFDTDGDGVTDAYDIREFGLTQDDYLGQVYDETFLFESFDRYQISEGGDGIVTRDEGNPTIEMPSDATTTNSHGALGKQYPSAVMRGWAGHNDKLVARFRFDADFNPDHRAWFVVGNDPNFSAGEYGAPHAGVYRDADGTLYFSHRAEGDTDATQVQFGVDDDGEFLASNRTNQYVIIEHIVNQHWRVEIGNSNQASPSYEEYFEYPNIENQFDSGPFILASNADTTSYTTFRIKQYDWSVVSSHERYQ